MLEFQDDIALRRIRKDVYQLDFGRYFINITAHNMVRRMVDHAKDIVREEMSVSVYDTPERSGYVRTGRMLRGIRSEDYSAGIAAGRIFIDDRVRAPSNDYYYPVSVEFGLLSHPAYYGRYFWHRSMPRIRSYFRDVVAPYYTDDLKRKLLGR